MRWWNGNGNCTGNYLVMVTNNFAIVAEGSSREEITTLLVLGRSMVLECRFLVMVLEVWVLDLMLSTCLAAPAASSSHFICDG